MKKVTAIVIGAGARGAKAYAGYAKLHPNELEITGVVEPVKERVDAIKKRFSIPEERCFSDYKDLFAREKLADAVFICTQDNMHIEPAKLALEKGYHILLEKPISPKADEICELEKLAKKNDRIISVCHVLRYTPFFKTLKELLNQKRIGRLISVQHNENVAYWHHAHSFVRGHWRNTAESSPMILAKCCHDMDILLYLIGSSCKKISSFGSLTHFKKENMPKGAPKRCIQGCPSGDSCPFNALTLYSTGGRMEDWLGIETMGFEADEESFIKGLETSPYGRCVYQCDNDVVDHQVVNMEFENEVTVAFTMCAFTSDCSRTMKFMGTKGEILGNMEEKSIIVKDFETGNIERICIHSCDEGHSGGDAGIVHSFVRAVNGTVKDNSSLAEAVQSHMMAFAAEKSRLTGSVIEMKTFVSDLEKERG